MPFGFFGLGNKKNKEKQVQQPPQPPITPWQQPPQPPVEPYTPVTPVNPIPPTPPVPPVTPAVPEQRSVIPQPVYSPTWTPSASADLPILIIGQSQELILDFICSFKNNADELFVRGGLSFYSNDMKTNSKVIKTKKAIEMCFCGAESFEWPVYEEATLSGAVPEPVRYEFTVGVSGMQSVSLRLILTCVTSEYNCLDLARQSAAVWILTDGNKKMSTYDYNIQNFIMSPAVKDVPLYFLVSYFENIYHFRGTGANAKFDKENKAELYQNCCSKFSSCCRQAERNGRVCYMQIYGGLEIKKTNGMGLPVFGLGSNNYFGSYMPIACHLPLYFVIEQIKNNPQSFFSTEQGRVILNALQNCFMPYIGSKQWQYQLIVKE